MSQVMADTEFGEERFPNIPETMLFLLLKGAMPDLADSVVALGREHITVEIMVALFAKLAYIMVTNMLIGVLAAVMNVELYVKKPIKEMLGIKVVMLLISSRMLTRRAPSPPLSIAGRQIWSAS